MMLMLSTASVQGARAENEDRVRVFDIIPHEVRLLCVHDGHGGSATDERLCALWEERVAEWHITRPRYEQWVELTLPQAMHLLYDAFAHFTTALLTEHSGAVSVVVLCLPQNRMVFAWLGDCEAGVFHDDEEEESKEGFGCDMAVHHHHNNKHQRLAHYFAAASTQSHTLAHACTEPHTLMPHGLVFPSLFDTSDAVHAAHSLTLKGLPQEHPAYKEYALCVQHARQQQKKEEPLLLVDVVTVQRGAYRAFADTRLHMAVQPTRVFGDCSMGPAKGIMREPALLAVTTAASNQQLLVMCSDGLFADGAFPNLAAAARCAQAPLAYLRAHLIADRPLFQGLDAQHEAENQALARRCRDECTTWGRMMRFLSIDYLAALQRPGVVAAYAMLAGQEEPTVRLSRPYKYYQFRTFALLPGSKRRTQHHPPHEEKDDLLVLPQSYFQWLQACAASLSWLVTWSTTVHHNDNNNNEVQQQVTLDAEALAHLAVVLGSTDNVSVVLLQWPSVPVSVTPAIDLLRSTPPATKQHRRRRRLPPLPMES